MGVNKASGEWQARQLRLAVILARSRRDPRARRGPAEQGCRRRDEYRRRGALQRGESGLIAT